MQNLETNNVLEVEFHLAQISSKESLHCFFYRGNSMFPTLRSGSFLHVRYVVSNIVPGDLVVFTFPSLGDCLVVHRVVKVDKNGFLTRGDNNLFVDDELVIPSQVIGRVELMEFQGCLRTVIGAELGLRLAQVRWNLLLISKWLRQMFWIPYQLIRKSGIVSIIWRPKIVKLRVQQAGGSQIKYIYKRRTVATWDCAHHRFDCHKPFDLVIPNPDEIK